MKQARQRTPQSSSLSPKTKRTRQLPGELQDKILSRLHPLDTKQLNQSWYELNKLRATLFRDFILNLIKFSEVNPECIFSIWFTNKYSDSEDGDLVVQHKPSSEDDVENIVNIAHTITRFAKRNSTNSSSSTLTPRQLQRSAVNLDISTRFDYIARTTHINMTIEKGTPTQRSQLMHIFKDMQGKVFPHVTITKTGGRKQLNIN